MFAVFSGLSWFLRLISMAIFVWTLMSWIMPQSQVYRWLGNFVAPFLSPFRKLSMRISAKLGFGVDFSGWFAILALSLLTRLVWMVYGMLPLALR